MTAADVRYGRQGGGWLPSPTKAETAAALAHLVYVRCDCPPSIVRGWWVIPRDVARPCHACGGPRRVLTDRGRPAA